MIHWFFFIIHTLQNIPMPSAVHKSPPRHHHHQSSLQSNAFHATARSLPVLLQIRIVFQRRCVSVHSLIILLTWIIESIRWSSGSIIKVQSYRETSKDFTFKYRTTQLHGGWPGVYYSTLQQLTQCALDGDDEMVTIIRQK